MVKILVEKKDDGREAQIEMRGTNFEIMTEVTLGVIKLCEGMAGDNTLEKGALLYGIGKTLCGQALEMK